MFFGERDVGFTCILLTANEKDEVITEGIREVSKLGILGTQKRQATAIFAALGVAALSACGTGDDAGDKGFSHDGAGSADKAFATAAAPTASEKELLLVNEVPGITFDKPIDKSITDLAAGPLADSMSIEPKECSKFQEASTRISDLTGTFAEFKNEKVVASVALSKQPDLYDQYQDATDGCSELKMTTDGKQAAEEAMKGQDIPPEAKDIIEGMDFSANYTIRLSEWDPKISVSPEKVAAHETSGTGQMSGINTEISGFRIMGVVNGVVIIVTTTPFADLDKVGDAGIAGQTGAEGITPEAKDAAKTHAVEVFDAQAKKIMAAK